jgi:predicted nucleic acid-binding protein
VTRSKRSAGDIVKTLGLKSDDLAHMREVFEMFPVLASQLRQPEEARLVIDANALIADIRWLVKKRAKPTARTALQEAIASKTVVAFAPSFLDEEMHTKLADVAQRESIPLEPMLKAWRLYRAEIRFYETVRPITSVGTSKVADPKDVPYVSAYTAFGAAAILTDDAHLSRMGARTVRFELTIAMRDYARAASIELTLKWHGMLLFAIGIELIRQLYQLVRAVARGIAKAPRPLQLLLGAGLLAALIYRPTRERLIEALRTGGKSAIGMAAEVMPLLGTVVLEVKEQEVKALRAWEKVAPHVVARRVPLGAHVLAICAAAGTPLTTEKIVRQLNRLGVRTTAKSFPRYLRTTLRGQAGLEEVGPNRWRAKAVILPPLE